MEGCLSIKTDPDTNELNVIAELPNGEYQKHFIYLNDWTMYTVEQIDSTKTDKYNYEFNFLPQELPGVKMLITVTRRRTLKLSASWDRL